MSTIKCVARVPMDLLTVQPPPPQHVPIDVSGHLMKRGKLNPAFQRRLFRLTDTELTYSRDGELRGAIPLAGILAVQPHVNESVARGLELVTRERTWIIAADDDADYSRWVDAICHQVPFDVVNILYRRMLQLPEVSDAGPNEVRLVLLPSYTVAETVVHIFECYENQVDAIRLHPHAAEDFVLQISDTTIVLGNGTMPLDNVEHVQYCLATKKTLCLTIVRPGGGNHQASMAQAPLTNELVF
ncbi:Aste57867_19629 [Aphanomyces stellatus]|uniref:Aste57867_19629 protein n=1 Tax=Aphanomyces stellatus TaxID=120398 RepID=A0A485LE88_9STRA|nr:hypothetical protein As57867_019564 [Aphanomyces stellatus]VFT96329.1 Aste57867_19629 [Aphanomyces stellatus]